MNPSELFALVITDSEVMSGEAVFAGSRVPIAVVLDSLDAGVSFERVKAAYAFLTDEHLQAARAHEVAHPRFLTSSR